MVTLRGYRWWNRTNVPVDINPFITHLAHVVPQHRGLCPLLFTNCSSVENRAKELWDGSYGFSSLSEKTRISNQLLMSQQRQHILLTFILHNFTFSLAVRGSQKRSRHIILQAELKYRHYCTVFVVCKQKVFFKLCHFHFSVLILIFCCWHS